MVMVVSVMRTWDMSIVPKWHTRILYVGYTVLVMVFSGDADASSEVAVFKILMVGDSGTGKSSLLLRYVDNVVPEDLTSTIGKCLKRLTLEKEWILKANRSKSMERDTKSLFGILQDKNGSVR
jgi:hypothetical protein